jgi:hypothetical protein
MEVVPNQGPCRDFFVGVADADRVLAGVQDGAHAQAGCVGGCMDQHRHEEFLKFLRTIDREVPKTLAVHMILDNYATHKHPAVKARMAAHPRFHLHFTPTSSSWLNLVERWFRELTDKALRRGVFHSVPDLIASNEKYMDAHNQNPKPFVWTATAESILTKVRRGRVAPNQPVSQ